jgi:hypothetical protein
VQADKAAKQPWQLGLAQVEVVALAQALDYREVTPLVPLATPLAHRVATPNYLVQAVLNSAALRLPTFNPLELLRLAALLCGLAQVVAGVAGLLLQTQRLQLVLAVLATLTQSVVVVLLAHLLRQEQRVQRV